MRPAAAFPMDDTTGLMFTHLRQIEPMLADLFERIFISMTPVTMAAQTEHTDWVSENPIFEIIELPDGLEIGEHFHQLYTAAAEAVPAAQVMHLCYIDRLAFALNEHRQAFMQDIRTLEPGQTPIIFQRSPYAWSTHPENYREIEGMVTRTGELLFGELLDYAWCHIALLAGTLRNILPEVKNPDLSMVAEIILQRRAEFKTKEVDWLAWEDPFVLSTDAGKLKAVREQSQTEMQKRLRYAIPMLQLLQSAAENRT